MAKRTLEQLQKQYNASASNNAPKGMPMHPPGRGPMMRGAKGKPKNTAKTVKRIWGYVSNYKLRLIVVVLCMLLHTVTGLMGPYLLAPIINRITMVVAPDKALNPGKLELLADGIIEKLSQMPIINNLLNGTAYHQVMTYVIAAMMIMLSVYLISCLCSYVQSRMMLAISQNATESIRNDLFNKLQGLPISFFDKHPTGEVMSRFTNDVDNIDMMLNSSLTSLVSGVVTLVGTFIFMLTTNVWLTLVTVVFIPVFAKGGAFIAKRSSKYYSGQQAALGAVNGYIEETVTGQKVIKVFNHEENCVDEMILLNNDMRDKQFKAQFFGGIMGPIMGNTSQITYAITIGLGGILMCTSGFTPGGLTVFAQYSRQFSMPINMISNQMSTVFAALAGAERVFGIIDESPEQNLDNITNVDVIKGYVELKNVTFGYNPDKPVLKDISLYAKPGQKIAFVGSTGAGKTTITNLINRFYDIDKGSITIDGVDIRNIDRSKLRSNIAMVLQDTHLFTGTVMENIRYGRPDATDEEVIAAANTAAAHSFITKLKDGYNTLLEGDGANLSQGQRQLLNIARAAVSKAPILVLDEATSSVDTRTERNIDIGMDRLMTDRTTFVIAHRLSTVRNANAIMVLENGEIIERGTHEQLLEMKGRYYELHTGVRELD